MTTDPLPFHCPDCGALLLDHGDHDTPTHRALGVLPYRPHEPDCPQLRPAPAAGPAYDDDGNRVWHVGASDWTTPDSWAEVERRATTGDQLADLCLALHRHALDTAELDGLSTTDDADNRLE